MALSVEAEPIPLVTDRDGVVRVGGTRLTLDTLIEAFHEGATPEEMVQQYPAISLGVVYVVIGYYLRHQRAVDEYLRERRQQADLLWQEHERNHDLTGIRARLLARRAASSQAL